MFFSSLKSGRISPKDARERLQKEPDTVLLDVRTPSEYMERRIPGSVNLPLDRISQIEKLVPSKNTPLIVYCLSGGRASSAVSVLGRMGYTNVVNLGGIMSWPYETESGSAR